MTGDDTTMRAFTRHRYGSPDVLRLELVPRPTVTDDGVLVRVRATSVNALEWHTLRGKPYIARLTDGLRGPKSALLGTDVAGVVEAVGANVTDLEPGDEVFGSRTGAFAEYVSARYLVPMPRGLTFEQAAAVSVAGQTALQGLRDKGRLRAGQRVLINGAGGGVGTFAVQIAKALGAEVTAVTGTRNLELVGSIGADHVVDYTRDDFTRSRGAYDLLLDIGGNRSLSSMRRALTRNGVVVLVAPSPGQWLGPVARVLGAVVTSRFTDRKVLPFLSSVRREDLFVLKELIEAGRVVPVIDRTYPFERLPDAIRHVETGNASGKVVITVD
jgi:NADPH:quinone reductase-like Zn-dependent oxidoreductase